ncbi:hypothetical protein WJX81_004573 [Elliptochloris bilobata]|uniref:Membrane insertase YidC/Oxa/ALB C-terminal domain-containing protein n=1 Tax=Elliptochloris bilobata TaxID=381761 RepID=A0AAW1QJW0_9CHLO
MQLVLTHMHDLTGLPWWASIMAATVALRLLIFPIQVWAMKNTRKLAIAKPEVQKAADWFREESTRPGVDVRQLKQQYFTRIQAVYAKHKANPVTAFTPILIQGPLLIGAFTGLRALAQHKVPSFVEGGALWFPDLSMPDPIYGLPVLTASVFLLMVELNASDGMEGHDAEMIQRMKIFMRFFAPLLVVMGGTLPAGVWMYWCTTNVWSIAQARLLRLAPVRSVLGLWPAEKARAAAAAPQLDSATLAAAAALQGKKACSEQLCRARTRNGQRESLRNGR